MSGTATLDAPTTDDAAKPKPKPPANPPPSPVLAGATAGMSPPTSALSDQLARDRADIEAKTPTMPVLQKPPKPDTNPDPFMAWGQPAMLMATLGSLFTRQPLINSLNAAAGVMKATNEKDAALAKQKYDEWKVETDNAIKLSEFQEKVYDAAIKKMDVDAKAGRAEMQAHMDGYKDEVLKQAYAHGGWAEVKSLLFARKGQNDAMGQSLKSMESQIELQSIQLYFDAVKSGDPAKMQQAKMFAGAVQLAKTGKLPEENEADKNSREWKQAIDPSNNQVFFWKSDAAGHIQATDIHGNEYQPGGMARITSAPQTGSAADLAASTTALVQKQNPGMDPAQAKLKAESMIRDAKEPGGLTPETATRMIDFALDTGNWAMINGWSRSEKDKRIIADTFYQRAAERKMSDEQINAIYQANIAQVAQVRAQAGTAGKRLENIEIATNEAARTIPLAQAAYEKLPRGEFRPFNELQALVASNQTSAAQKAALAADNEVIATISRALNPNGVGREGEQETLRNILSTTGDSPEAHKAVLDQWVLGLQAIKAASADSADDVVNSIRTRVGLGPMPTMTTTPQGGGSQQPAAPPVGTVQGGFRFKGGDPASPQSWEKVGG